MNDKEYEKTNTQLKEEINELKTKINKYQSESIKNNQSNTNVKTAYLVFRYIEGLCIAVFVFGFLWEGTEILKLTLPEFLMLYGGSGAIISEFLARILHRQIKKKEKKTVKPTEEKSNGSP